MLLQYALTKCVMVPMCDCDRRKKFLPKCWQEFWQASSQHAIWFPQDRIILEKQVVIENLQSNELIKRIETSTLEMLFPDNRLQNDQAVFIQGDGFYIEGTGLRADLTDKTLQLIQHNKTVYRNEG